MYRNIRLNKYNSYMDFIFILAGLMMLSAIERVFFPVIIPGFKIGLSNILFLLIIFDKSYLYLIQLQAYRIIGINIMFGTFSTIFFALFGGFSSITVMYLLVKYFKQYLSIYVISMAGAISHNIFQIFFACIYFNDLIYFYYIPVVIITGTLSGFIIAFLYEKIRGEDELKF